MTLSVRFSLLFAVLGLILALATSSIAAWQSFDVERQRLIGDSERVVASQSSLAIDLVARDTNRLGIQLDEQLESGAGMYAAIFNSDGELLALNYRESEIAYRLPAFRTLRDGLQPLQTGVHRRYVDPDNPGGDSEPDWVARLLPRVLLRSISDVSVPVVTPLNPLESELTASSLADAAMNRGASSSRFVVGYVNVGISHSALWAALLPGVLRTLLLSCLGIALASYLLWRYAQRHLGPIAQLSELAEQAATREIDPDLRFRATGEARHIANLLNMMMSEFKSYRAGLSVDQKLLSLKVEERDSQLQERDVELNRAISEVSRTREDLQRMAFFDSLTGLPNRRLFTEQLTLMLRLAQRNKTTLALMFLDIDNFKRINDSLGHSAGDLLLREVGIRLSKCLRDSDVVAHPNVEDSGAKLSRLGGDEFTVLLANVDDNNAAALVAERMLEVMTTPLVLDGHELIITPSIGIAMGPHDADDVEGLLKAADTAMYQAKDSGKNSYVFYTAEMESQGVARLKLETDLRRAVERRELLLEYQPQISMKTGSVVGVEALIRWRHSERGLIRPDEFIPLAEELGLMLEFSRWTLMEACRELASLNTEGTDLRRVGVNISPLAVSEILPDLVREALARYNIDPGLLELELTESVLMEGNAASIGSLQQLKDFGVALAIDDFGTGYSSLSYLSHFPLDSLKIDRSFVSDFDKSQSNASLVEAIVAMASSLNLGVIAEGVETTEQFQFLTGLGVEVAQGYLFSKPVPADTVAGMLAPGHFRPRLERLALAAEAAINMEPA